MHRIQTAPQTVSQLSNAAGVVTIPPNPHRCAILVGPPVGRTLLVSFGGNGTAGQGVPVSSNVGYVFLSAADVGRGIEAAVTLTDSGGAQQTFTWTEWIYGA